MALLASIAMPSMAQTGEAARGAVAEFPLLAPIDTRYAHFAPTRFSDLDGWRGDNVSEAWSALRESCRALGNRSAWSGLCERARLVNGTDNSAVRSFFEREFVVFQIHDRNRSPAGVITGYYEALLNGSRSAGERYRYPVFGKPNDLLTLDARAVPPSATVVSTFARVDGKRVLPLPQRDDMTGGPGMFLLDLGPLRPDVRDKLLRVRIDNQRIVPYYTRSEIDAGRIDAPILAWVDNAEALYSMQVQGAGKIRLEDGSMLRVAFAEQNGHPFTPPVSAPSAKQSRSGPLLRGFPLPASTPEDEIVDALSDPPKTRSLRPMAEEDKADEALPADVARIVDLLLGNIADEPRPAAAQRPAPKSSPRPPPAKIANAVRPDPVPSPAASAPRPPDARKTFASDPSYVFFREIADDASGPIGALGVRLTAERSVAVDPRTTPLGYPVFITTEGYGGVSPVNRLVLAQDTGGAIRGAVRADYFVGFGPQAYERASRMRQLGRMWLLVPKDQPLAGTMATRGLGGQDAMHDCLVPDPDFCVE